MLPIHYMLEHEEPTEPAVRIVSALLWDVTDLRGWRHEWDRFDEDVRRSIVARWLELVRNELGR